MPTTSWVTGTATNDQDLYAKLLTFLTTDADLVAAGEEWTEVWDHEDGDEAGIVLQGPGLSGSDQICVGLRLNRDVPSDEYNIEVRGMTGFSTGAVELEDHVNVSPNPVYSFADSGAMTYWFVASGRHFVVITKITTVYEALYAGWFLPFGTPSEYPYPMFIGGSAGRFVANSVGSPTSWRDDVEGHTQFPFCSFRSSSSQQHDPMAWVLDPSGNWIALSNTGNSREGTIGPVYTQGYKDTGDNDSQNLNAYEGFLQMMSCYGGDQMIWPMTIHQTNPGSQTYGVLDGCFKCQGVGMGVEDVITVGGVDHLVVQNAFRTDLFDYWCLELN